LLQVLGLPAAEHFPTLLTVSNFDEGSLVMATSTGGIKRTALTAFSKLKASGLGAVKLLQVRWRSVVLRTIAAGMAGS
jgi:DNA gyrase subunit A